MKTFLNINESHHATPSEDTDGTEVVSRLAAATPLVDVTSDGDTKQEGQSLAELDETPGISKVPGPDLLKQVHFQRILVTSQEEAVHPYKDHIPTMTFDLNKPIIDPSCYCQCS